MSRRLSSKKQAKKKVLESLRLSKSGGSRIEQVELDEDSIFETVTEGEYQDLVRKRRNEATFVEDDDGAMGYYDDGEEQFYDDIPEDGETYMDENDLQSKGTGQGALSSAYIRRAKRKQREKLGDQDKTQKVTMFFDKNSIAEPASGLDGAHIVKRKRDADLDFDSMLNELTNNPHKNVRERKRTSSIYTRPNKTFSDSLSNQHIAESIEVSTDDLFAQQNKTKADPTDEEAWDLPAPNNFTDDDPTDSLMMEPAPEESLGNLDSNFETCQPKQKLSKRELMLMKARGTKFLATAPTKKTIAAMQEKSHEEEEEEELPTMEDNPIPSSVPSNEVSEWWTVNKDGADGVEQDNAHATNVEKVAVAKAGIVHMYWTDIVEVRDRPGKVYLLGKMKIEDTNPPKYKSCCVVVKNIMRYMYVVPKVPEGQLSVMEMTEDERNGIWMKVHEELQKILVPAVISDRKNQQCFQTKLVERSYAFELDDVPRGKSMFLKLKYHAKYPRPPSDFCEKGGKSYSRILGHDTPTSEIFIVRRRLLGPGWVEIQHAQPIAPESSYCKVEYEVDDPKFVTPVQGLPPPPLTVMSLTMKTVCNPSNQKHEVVAISSIVQAEVQSEGGASTTLGSFAHFTVVRPLGSNHRFPDSYQQVALRDERYRNGDTLRIELNERALLNYFINRVQREDPDVIVGHNIQKYGLDVLLSRLDVYKLGGQWSKISRMRRGRLNPMKQGEGWNEYKLGDISNGRLICDTYVAAKELLSSQPNYTLSFLVQSQLNRSRREVDMLDIEAILEGGPQQFLDFCRHTSDDAMFVLQLMHKLEVLPLSKQLSNLCGYKWGHTLEANKRAERIEYLLLHEFNKSKAKFVVPDKFDSKKKALNNQGKKEPSYAGGMVFAPMKGLYDDFVVLLDFASLYPSIIREYNICFTTVERKLGESETSLEGDIPNLPSSGQSDGVLPSVIKRLLESRKQVKQELKKEQKTGNAEKSKRLDIRQKAIKLTANSMYGCLGFKNSRFYCKSLAALITSTGRETLEKAKSVAENECGYDVIYGDTDSIMVNSRSRDLREAKRIGHEIQGKCNKQFKLLELEVDNIFKTILLLNKKKYAAIVVKEDETNGQVKYEKEVKGLDMVRRDWCVLSKNVGSDVLDLILSGNARDEVVEQIHEYLGVVADRVRSGKESLDQFVITKSLNKPPEQYPDKSKQYHVQVALAMKSQGKIVDVGSHIPYVLCKEQEVSSGRLAYHPDEVKKSDGKLNIDLEWYLEAQIHPPINRLCANIDGTSSPQLAHCLGLDTSKFAHSIHNEEDHDDAVLNIPSVLQDDATRFKSCIPISLTCGQCAQTSDFPGVFHVAKKSDQTCVFQSGLDCPHPECKSPFWGYNEPGMFDQPGDDLSALLANKIWLSIRAFTKRYYQGWSVCTESTCQARTQQQSLRSDRGNSCVVPGCRGTVKLEYSDTELYTQLKYYQSLFDPVRARVRLEKQLASSKVESILPSLPSLPQRHSEIYSGLYEQMEEIIRHNDYNWIRPSIWGSLFKPKSAA